MDYPKVCLRRGEEAGVLKGQKLIYDNELDWADDICIDGCVVDVLDSRQHFVARGFFNARSKLTVRVLTRRAEETIDRDFFARRIRAAWQTRQTLGFSDSCRVVFGESDGLPGLIADRFEDVLSVPARPDGGQIRRLSVVPDRLPRSRAVERNAGGDPRGDLCPARDL